MSGSPTDPDSDFDDENRGDTSASESAASDPESAHRKAEEALARVEALAGIHEVETAESVTGVSSGPPSPSSTDSSSDEHCENCGAVLHGPSCSQCSQKAEGRIVPIWHLLNEALDALSISFGPATAEVQQEVEATRSLIDSLQAAVVQPAAPSGSDSDESGTTPTDREKALEELGKELESLGGCRTIATHCRKRLRKFPSTVILTSSRLQLRR